MLLKTKIKLLNGIGYTLITIQLLGFLGNLGKPAEPIKDNAELIGYYIGSNLFLIIAIILFLKARSLRKKGKESEQADLVDSIGKTE